MEVVENMTAVMAHGGPDGQGVYVDERAGLALGHRRLAIIDLTEGGAQPMVRDHLTIVFNGEVYNFQELRDELTRCGFTFSSTSDTEVVLRAYQLWGKACFPKFSGMFALAIWDSKEHFLVLARDRMGVKPLYWSLTEGALLFASELKAFHEFAGFAPVIDQEAVSLYLQAGYIRAPFTIYKEVKKLEPATIAEINDQGNITFSTFWRPELPSVKFSTSNDINENELSGWQNLRTGFLQRMVSDVPVGAFLSGGIDSSLLVAALNPHNPSLSTFTMGIEENDWNEAPQAKELAETLGTRHYEFTCQKESLKEVAALLPEIFDEPFGDSSAVPTYLIARHARSQVKVVLSADGGDEVFGGYDRYRYVLQYWRWIRYIPLTLRKCIAWNVDVAWTSGFLPGMLRLRQANTYAFSPSRTRKLAALFRAKNVWEALYALSSLSDQSTVKALHRAPLSNHFFAVTPAFNKHQLVSALGIAEMSSYLEGDILVKVDRTTMSLGLEAREPFLDKDIVALGLSLPDRLKIHSGKGKWWLRQLSNIQLPAGISQRAKKGFGVPLDTWLRSDFATDLVAMSEDPAFSHHFELDQNALNNLINKYLHSKNSLIDAHFIWALYCLYQWYRRWEVKDSNS